MRSRRCSGPGRPAGDAKASGRRVTSQGTFGPTWKEGQAAPRRRPQPFSRILTAWKVNSPKSTLADLYSPHPAGRVSYTTMGEFYSDLKAS